VAEKFAGNKHVGSQDGGGSSFISEPEQLGPVRESEATARSVEAAVQAAGKAARPTAAIVA
jgi:hypothetical protein